MYVSIGKSNVPPGLVGVLFECHQRIRTFGQLAITLATRTDLPSDELSEACIRCIRYFSEALPHHVADEDESIVPRLRGHRPDVDAALQTMSQQHIEHQPLLRDFLQQLHDIQKAPTDLGLRAAFAGQATVLAAEFAKHLELEERVIFPALNTLLTEDERNQIIRELPQRRIPKR